MTDPTEPMSPPIPTTRVPPPPRGPGGSQDGTGGPAVYVAIGCAAAAFLTLCAGGGAGVLYAVSHGASGASNATGRVVRARGPGLVASGARGLGPGASCELPIEEVREPDGSLLCHVVVTCGGIALYGDARAGYFPCTFAPGSVTGSDTNTSSVDRDAAFTVSTPVRTFELHDDAAGPIGAFAVSGTITTLE